MSDKFELPIILLGMLLGGSAVGYFYLLAAPIGAYLGACVSAILYGSWRTRHEPN